MKAIWKARLFRVLREIAGRVNLPCIFLLTAVEFSKAIESNESSGCVEMPWVHMFLIAFGQRSRAILNAVTTNYSCRYRRQGLRQVWNGRNRSDG